MGAKTNERTRLTTSQIGDKNMIIHGGKPQIHKLTELGPRYLSLSTLLSVHDQEHGVETIFTAVVPYGCVLRIVDLDGKEYVFPERTQFRLKRRGNLYLTSITEIINATAYKELR